MKKIPSLFLRDFDNNPRLVTRNINPECQWVIDGKGVATRKWDGTAVLFKDGKYWKRYDAKHGKTPPEGFVPAQPQADPNTGHWPGWLPVGEGKEDMWIREAIGGKEGIEGETYEAIGPKINGNKEKYAFHTLRKHGATIIFDVPTDFSYLKQCLVYANMEGIVWHHPDGRMAKIKKSDFGLEW